jgi:Tol biopolymer transport system component
MHGEPVAPETYEISVRARRHRIAGRLTGQYRTRGHASLISLQEVPLKRFRSLPLLAAAVPFVLSACAETSQTLLMPEDAPLFSQLPNWSEWSEATDAPFAAVNTATATEGCPFVTQSGKLLVFASNRAGGFGDTPNLDLYLSHWNASSKQWGEPVNMGSAVNTGANEQCPLLSANGRELLFVSNRPGAGGLDLWMARRSDKSSDFDWQPAVNLAALNTPDDEFGPSWYQEGGRTVLYFNSNRGGTTHNFYVSTANRDGTFPAATPAVGLNTAAHEQFAALSRDGLEIIFASNRDHGVGGFDLWRATRLSTSAAWGPPQNLGPNVNSQYAEGRAALSWDGRTLYFHSNRNGSVDLFQSTRSR